jgi:hypothetical protein
MTNDSSRQRVFRRILAREAGMGADPPAVAAAALRVCERFAEQMTLLIGDTGVAAICVRTLHLAERNVRGLASVRASVQGDSPFVLLQSALEQEEPAAATEAAIAVLATATELLTSLIGEGLTASLLREAWPQDFADDTPEDTVV